MQAIRGIVLSAGQLESLARLAQDSLPNESCAFLLGRGESKDDDDDDDTELRVVKIMPMRNADGSAVSFSIEPSDLLRAYEFAESSNLHVVGIFHSHPAKPSPSGTDKKFMEINPVVWLIYSTITHQFKAYICGDDNRISEVAVKIKG